MIVKHGILFDLCFLFYGYLTKCILNMTTKIIGRETYFLLYKTPIKLKDNKNRKGTSCQNIALHLACLG